MKETPVFSGATRFATHAAENVQNFCHPSDGWQILLAKPYHIEGAAIISTCRRTQYHGLLQYDRQTTNKIIRPLGPQAKF